MLCNPNLGSNMTLWKLVRYLALTFFSPGGGSSAGEQHFNDTSEKMILNFILIFLKNIADRPHPVLTHCLLIDTSNCKF